MMMLFWLCLFLIAFVYLGYPMLLALGILGKARPIARQRILPTLSVLIPAHDEEKSIRKKLQNVLEQDYPREKLEILVGNDGSRDATASIVREMAACGVRLVDSAKQCGKSAIQNMLVGCSHGEILVFTDADCLLPRNALSTLVENFVDPKVALVTNCAAIVNTHETAVAESEGLYWKYERWLREQESERGLLAMASGSLFAMRRQLWSPLDPDVGDDFALPLKVARAGKRNVLDMRISAETLLAQNQPHSMFRMKMRIISKDLRGLLRNSACLNPFQVGRLAVTLWSHKLLRWAIPYFLLGLLLSNLFLLGQGGFYQFSLSAQLGFYGASIAGLLLEPRRLRFPLSAASSFCLVNAAALLGTLHCLSWQSAGQWKTVR